MESLPQYESRYPSISGAWEVCCRIWWYNRHGRNPDLCFKKHERHLQEIWVPRLTFKSVWKWLEVALVFLFWNHFSEPSKVYNASQTLFDESKPWWRRWLRGIGDPVQGQSYQAYDLVVGQGNPGVCRSKPIGNLIMLSLYLIFGQRLKVFGATLMR